MNDRRDPDPRLDAMQRLAASVRALCDAAASTNLAAEEVDDVRAAIDVQTERLRSCHHDGPYSGLMRLPLDYRDPQAFLQKIQHGGEVFLGNTPVASGDYYAGPSHTLPTDTTGRFTSGVSCYTFMKRTGTVAYPNGMPGSAIRHIAAMAEAEGLDGHAASVRRRGCWAVV